MSAHPNHGAMYLNYRSLYKAKHGVDAKMNDSELEAIIECHRGYSSNAETEAAVLDDMKEGEDNELGRE